ncbi:MAG: TM2 domain-containing protein [Chloroflexi bacterium]|nr:TM2 domain-containing protein [Chloroflexota bacterium]
MASESMQPTKSKIVAGILGILLGALGIHKFYLGYVGAGIVHIVLTILIITAPISGIIGLIEGIMYLVKPDDEFHDTYVANKKAWF